MAEMNDYSGPLKADFRFEDLSKEALIKLLYAYAKLYLLMYGELTNLVTERQGKDEAWKYQVEAWMRMRAIAFN
jgi:general stress protein 26